LVSFFEILETLPPLFASANLFTKAAVRKNLTFKPFLRPSTPMAVARCVFPLWKAFHKGKTHLAVGLSMEALSRGISVYFTTLTRMIGDLKKAYENQSLMRRMKVYSSTKLLVVDEVGYLPLDSLGSSLFFQLISARYERGSIILTSNKVFGEWGELLGDPVLATAVLDRLLHHAHIINIRGNSYRLKDRAKTGLYKNPQANV